MQKAYKQNLQPAKASQRRHKKHNEHQNKYITNVFNGDKLQNASCAPNVCPVAHRTFPCQIVRSSEFHTRPALAQPPPSSRSPQSSPCHEDVPRLDVTVNQLPGVQMHQPGHHVLQEPSARLWRQMPKAMLLDLIVEIPTQKLHLDVPDALAGHEVNLVPPRNKTKKTEKQKTH